MTLKLREVPVEIDGHVYTLRCNMSVLERLQEEFDGKITDLINMPPAKAVFLIFKAMLDDCCEDEDLPPIQMRKLKKLFGPAQLGKLGVLRLFTESLYVTPEESRNPSETDTGTNPAEEQPGN